MNNFSESLFIHDNNQSSRLGILEKFSGIVFFNEVNVSSDPHRMYMSPCGCLIEGFIIGHNYLNGKHKYCSMFNLCD